MYWWAEKIFYTLSAVILGSAFFVLQPNDNPQITSFQTEIKQQFVKASVQVIGDQPLFESVDLVVSSINKFYEESADALIAILTPATSEQDMFLIAETFYKDFQLALNLEIAQPQVLGIETPEAVPNNFMQEDPVFNIVPLHSINETPSQVSASMTLDDFPVINRRVTPTWINLEDNITGQVYCVGIFNAEVNRYLGPCKNDYY